VSGKSHPGQWFFGRFGGAAHGRGIIAAAALLAVGGLTACATPPPADDKEAVAAYREANDPLEPLNRYLFEVNLGLDRLFLRPVAEIYRGALPDPAREGVRNFMNNLDTPSIFVHDVLQGESERAGDSIGRFTTNTFYGVGGIFDVAEGDLPDDLEAGIPYHGEDLGQTLAVWGVGPGPYLMLPLLGPSNLRDAIGLAGGRYLDPLHYLVPRDRRTGFSIARATVGGLDLRARNIETFDEIERGAIDFYATVRSLYRQHRKAEIANGRGPANPLPEMSDEIEEDNKAERVSATNK
jgi:phospholipid-binding lipoprotein MlaA